VDVEVKFFFYLAAVLCFLIAAAGEGWRYGSRGRRGLPARVVLVPLGLALAFFPTMWDAGVEAF
jgi:hypothetical protein